MKSDNVTTEINAKQIVYTGVPAAGGIAIGDVVILNRSNKKINKYIQKNRVETELNKIDKLLKEVINEYSAISNSLVNDQNNLAEIYETHVMVLEDDILKNNFNDLIKKGISSEYAIKEVFNEKIEKLKSSDNQLMRERSNDFEELKNILLERLTEDEEIEIAEGSIVFSKHISTKDIYVYLQKGAVGFVSEKGGITSHASIIARSFNVPYIFGIKSLTKKCCDYESAIIDATIGKVYFSPDDNLKNIYKQKLTELEDRKKNILKIRDEKSVTKDGKKIVLKSNLDHASEIIDSKFSGAEGIGLVRTENVIDGKFIFDENKQFEIYQQIASSIYPNKATIRLFDYGSDKPPKGFIFKEANPALGQRGIRFLLSNPGILDTQIQAILRASSSGNIDILVPMISKVEEIVEVRRRIEINKEILKESGTNFDEKIQLGVMIEVPSMFYKMDKMSNLVDFYSIGTNDLMQYYFAADRINDNVTTYQAFDDVDFYHFVYDIVTKSKKQGKRISICGELAQSEETISTLIGMGVEELSVSVSKVLEIKNEIRQINAKAAKREFSKMLKT